MIALSSLVARYAAVGIVCTPLVGKRPTLTDWPTADASADDFDAPSVTGLGFILGARSAGLVDIDLDCDEAVRVRSTYLPPSRTFGRGGVTRHELARTLEGEARTRRFRDPHTGSTIVELRGDGAQTMAPGSVHPVTGERIEWTSSTPLYAAPYDELLVSVRELAVAVLLERYAVDAPRIVTDTIARWREEREGGPVGDGPALPYSVDVGIADRAEKYLSRMEPAISGSGGQAAIWRASLAMTRGFGLPVDAAIELLARVWNPTCKPAWSAAELRRTAINAADATDVPIGFLRDVPRRGRAA